MKIDDINVRVYTIALSNLVSAVTQSLNQRHEHVSVTRSRRRNKNENFVGSVRGRQAPSCTPRQAQSQSYFAFSYYEGNLVSATSYCDKTSNGWSRDATVRNWSCFSANKTTEVTPRVTKMLTPLRTHHQTYRNDHEMIERINSKQSSWTAKAYPEHEKYTVMEMGQRMGGLRSVPYNSPSPAAATPEQKARVSLLPKNFDWRDVEGVNYLAPVRDQGGCGSCYVFASMAMIESRIRIKTHNQRQDVFSTQDVVSCSMLSQGCDGGFSYLIAGRYAEDQGIVAEECNPYTGKVRKFKDDPCNTDSSCARTFVSDYEYLGGYYGACNEEKMLQALVEKGPLAVAYAVYDDFPNYDGGIYHHTGERNIFNPLEVSGRRKEEGNIGNMRNEQMEPKYVNHAVLLVGYGEDEITGEKFWTLKNSWSDSWGEDGYFRIRRGTNECAIESMAVDITAIP
ncbi:Dipeptidyl peptidase 1 [Portunus trituberculatus]|uniref:Dipeptidyl peptidase 1 n=1 Tax=Portunus trituberculatus TaxID=210409 RepID=A0A5B7D3V7_PORTR|nr:Dipeptidyl peptidase 1 [Portunus trituberculatus]